MHEVAVMVVVPVPTRVASPLVPVVLLMVATELFDEDHVTALVMEGPFAPLVALNWRLPDPRAGFGLRGMITMLVMAPQTVILAGPLVIPWEVAVMLVVPGDTPVTRPVLPLTVPMLGVDEDQVAVIEPV